MCNFMLCIVTSLCLSVYAAAADTTEPSGEHHVVGKAGWACGDVPIKSRWAGDVLPDNAWPQYPRPQFVRARWTSLNGLWEYAIAPADQPAPSTFAGKILVPFPIESALSGVQRELKPDQRLWYRSNFDLPANWRGGRVLLHFGAVDWKAEVWVNQTRLGEHRGGYDPFTFDITDALSGGGEQTLMVAVTDPTDRGTQPRGKQVRKPNSIWYTPTSGIWQSVWLEPVPATYINSVDITPDVDSSRVSIDVQAIAAGPEATVQATVRDGHRTISKISGHAGKPLTIEIPDAHLWSPDDPFLYDLDISLSGPSREADHIKSYFGMRKIAVAKDERGIPRLFLNNKPLFQYGLLDQGFWPAGLYTAPTDEALRYDIEIAKRLGFNMLRKHVKVEPARWYYWCDKLGLLIWQDMPSGDRYIGPHDPDIERSPASARQFSTEYQSMIDALRNHPSIVAWVPFNEGWGQFDTKQVAAWTKQHDPTRLVNSVTGWADRGVGDMHDIHSYPEPGMPPVETRRAVTLGEFGGHGLGVPGHTWRDKNNWGYRSFPDKQEVTKAYLASVDRLKPLIARGLSAAVYTQLTDVEIEVNGLLTYDRKVIKMEPSVLAAAHRSLFERPRALRDLVPTAEGKPQTWLYTTTKPNDDWMQPSFADSGWSQGQAGFGRDGTPGSVVRTAWTGADIWLRRAFEAGSVKDAQLFLRIHHDEDAEVYLNGELIKRLDRYTTSYIDEPLGAKALRALQPGKNVLAIHCHQTIGGQYIDAGLFVWGK